VTTIEPKATQILKKSSAEADEPKRVSDAANARTEAWLRDNRAAMDAWNAHMQDHELPLAQYRQF